MKESSLPRDANPYEKNPEGRLRELEEKDYQRTLYRDSTIGDLFLLWRDKTLPLKHHEGSIDSGLTPNTLTTFWFDQPMVFNKKKFNFLLKTDLKKWPSKPKYLAKGYMHYKSKDHQTSDIAYGGYSTPKSHVDEYYIGDVLSEDQLEIFTKEEPSESATAVALGLEKIIGLLKEGVVLERHKHSSSDVNTKDQDIAAAFKFIYRIFDEGIAQHEIHFMDMGLPYEEFKKRQDEARRQLFEFANNPENVEKIKAFYDWIQQLPKLKSYDIGNLDDAANWDLEVDKNNSVIRRGRSSY